MSANGPVRRKSGYDHGLPYRRPWLAIGTVVT
jgi:hypothetical protein